MKNRKNWEVALHLWHSINLFFIYFIDYELRNKITGDTADGSKDPEKADSSKYPIETYQGLEEATAERIKRFEDETKAMLMRNSRSDLTPATPEMGRTTSGTFSRDSNLTMIDI